MSETGPLKQLTDTTFADKVVVVDQTGAYGAPVVPSTDFQIIEISATTVPQAITFAQPVKSFSVSCTTTAAIVFRRLAADTNILTIPAVAGIAFNAQLSSPSDTVGYVNMVASTGTIQVIGTF